MSMKVIESCDNQYCIGCGLFEMEVVYLKIDSTIKEYTQCKNCDLKKDQLLEAGDTGEEYVYKFIIDLYTKLNVNFKFSYFYDNNKNVAIGGEYNSNNDIITISHFFKGQTHKWAIAALHELIHWTRYDTRLNRYTHMFACIREFNGVKVDICEELTAELGSLYLYRYFGILNLDKVQEYRDPVIKMYQNELPYGQAGRDFFSEDIEKQVQKAVDFIRKSLEQKK